MKEPHRHSSRWHRERGIRKLRRYVASSGDRCRPGERGTALRGHTATVAVAKSSIASRFEKIIGKSLGRGLPGSPREAEGDAGGQECGRGARSPFLGGPMGAGGLDVLTVKCMDVVVAH